MNDVASNNHVPSKEKLEKIKNKRLKRKLRSKEKKKLKKENNNKKKKVEGNEQIERYESTDDSKDVDIEYVPINPLEEYDKDDTIYQEFSSIFSKFMGNDEVEIVKDKEDKEDKEADQEMKEEEEEEEEKPKLSKRQKRLQRKIDVAVLKQLVKRPDLVEIHDCSAMDPFFLLHLKSYRNTVPVPRHWSMKRKYLQGKRGIEKPTFELPDYIKQTGIAEARQSILESDAEKKLKQRQRERLQPKMGRMDIDYHVFHDAFFVHLKKPKMTIHGDLYYEGKEHEIKLKEKTPGILSDELRKALGMPEGAPPPWLISMQRYGPPPSYPKLKVPGVNAPLPPGAQPGYHPGGWGAPPVDEYGRPIWGWIDDISTTTTQSSVDKTFVWGELQADQEEEEEEEEVEAEEPSEEMETEEVEQPPEPEHVPFIEEPEEFELRKYTKEKELDEDILAPKELYKIVKEKETAVGNEFVGTQRIYEFDKKDKTQPPPPQEPPTKKKEEQPKKKEKKEKFKF